MRILSCIAEEVKHKNIEVDIDYYKITNSDSTRALIGREAWLRESKDARVVNTPSPDVEM